MKSNTESAPMAEGTTLYVWSISQFSLSVGIVLFQKLVKSCSQTLFQSRRNRNLPNHSLQHCLWKCLVLYHCILIFWNCLIFWETKLQLERKKCTTENSKLYMCTGSLYYSISQTVGDHTNPQSSSGWLSIENSWPWWEILILECISEFLNSFFFCFTITSNGFHKVHTVLRYFPYIFRSIQCS